MDKKITLDIQCPRCHKKYKKNVWTEINIDTHPKIKTAIINDTFFMQTCPHCKCNHAFLHDILVESEKHDYAVFFSSNKASFNKQLYNANIKKETNSLIKNHNRIVEFKSDFIEKIRFFEANLDDRIIEIIKYLFLDVGQTTGKLSTIKYINANINQDGCCIDFYGDRNIRAILTLEKFNELYVIWKSSFVGPDKELLIDIDWAIEINETIDEYRKQI